LSEPVIADRTIEAFNISILLRIARFYINQGNEKWS